MPKDTSKKIRPVAEAVGRAGGRIESETFQAALAVYRSGLDALGRREWADARAKFLEVGAGYAEEREMVERAGMYARICEQRLAPAKPDPTTAAACYRRAVFLANQGRPDEALPLLDRALAEDPLSVDFLYARACVWALKGTADRAVADLRQAILVDRTVRFQAACDPDFQPIREEPSFIDIIEPTPARA